MSTVTSPAAARKVGILLTLGIIFLPPIFVWFLLREGYSVRARAIGLGWLGLMIVISVIDERNTNTAPQQTVELASSEPLKANSGPVVPASEAVSSVAVPKTEPKSRIANDAKIIDEIESRVKANQARLKKYYGTQQQLQQAVVDAAALTAAKVAYVDQGKSKEERALGRRVANLLVLVHEQSREIYASMMEEIFISNGMDAKVKATGKGKKHLRVVYALMSQPLIYKFQNDLKLGQQARSIGFSKLIYTNGFESDLGKTWAVNL